MHKKKNIFLTKSLMFFVSVISLAEILNIFTWELMEGFQFIHLNMWIWFVDYHTFFNMWIKHFIKATNSYRDYLIDWIIYFIYYFFITILFNHPLAKTEIKHMTILWFPASYFCMLHIYSHFSKTVKSVELFVRCKIPCSSTCSWESCTFIMHTNK